MERNPLTATPTPTRNDPLLTTPEAAAKIRSSEQFLESDRCTRRHGIPFVKIGRKVLYRESDLDDFVRRNMRNVVGAEAA